MSLNLDARQRAMLQEMGHPLWWPQAPASATPMSLENENIEEKKPVALIQQAKSAVKSEATVAEILNPQNVLQSAQQIQPIQQTPHSSAVADFAPPRFALGVPVQLNLVDFAALPAPEVTSASAASTAAPWLIVAELPDGPPPNGSAGRLLTNMLRAMRLSDVPLYWVPLVRLAQSTAPEDESPDIDALVHELKPGMALLLGLPVARHLLPGNTQPLGQLRQQVHALGSSALPAVVSHEAAYLLRTPQAKAQAWADLCMALERAGRSTI